MGLFKQKTPNAEEKNEPTKTKETETERSTSVTKKDKSEEVAAPETADTKPTQEVASADGAPEKDQQMLVRYQDVLPPTVIQNLQHLLSVMNPAKKGFEEMGGARWSAPIVKIHQAMTTEAPEHSKLGNIYTDLGDVTERLVFTPLYMYKTRAKFIEGQSNPECRSENTETNIYGQPCKDCPDYAFRKGERQECAESINVLAFDQSLSQILHLQFARTSFRAGFKLFRQASATARMWDRWYALTTEERTRTGNKSKYYVFSVSPTGDKVEPPELLDVMGTFNEKIAQVRQSVLSTIVQREGVSNKIFSQLNPEDFPAGGDGSAEDAPEPDFSSNKSM